MEMNEKLDKYLEYVDAYGYILSPLCLSLLSFYLLQFLDTTNIYVRLCMYPVTFGKYLVLWIRHLIFCVISHAGYLGMIHLTHLV